MTSNMAWQSAVPLPPMPEGWYAIEHSVCGDGSLAVLSADHDLVAEWNRLRAAHPPDKAFGGYTPSMEEAVETFNAQVLRLRDGRWLPGGQFPLETPYPVFDRFSDGRVLVVSVRTGGEDNARVIAPDGTLLRRMMLGDGVGRITIDTADRIWVEWFDEGIYGNRYWTVPEIEWPPSACGVACFADDGRLILAPEMPEGLDKTIECYALNASGPGVWIIPYGGFPLVRIVPEVEIEWWRMGLQGPSAVAVDGRFALVAGGYSADRDRLALVSMSSDKRQVELVATGRLPLRPAGQDRFEQATLVAGRGDRLHIIDDGIWYTWRVDEAVASQSAG